MTTLHLKNGFLPLRDPLKKLPASFSAWEKLASQLPSLLISDQLRKQILKLPPFPIEKLTSPALWERAMLLLSFISHAYVWNPTPTDHIPSLLAEPWSLVAEHLNRPPILSYASYVLHNWYRIDLSRPIELGNIAVLQHFLGGMDEAWFILTHVNIEAKALPALQLLLPALHSISQNNIEQLLFYLKKIANSLQAICESLERMHEHCDPYIYYQRVRTYVYGWKNPAFPSGVIYENCFDHQGQFFNGATGAQSSIIPAFDLFFGVQHEEDKLNAYLNEMQQYMPKAHRLFLQQLKQYPSLRDFVMQQSPSSLLSDLYNQSIELLIRFRSIHLRFAAVYIQKQSLHEKEKVLGTGGSDFMHELRKYKEETKLVRLI